MHSSVADPIKQYCEQLGWVQSRLNFVDAYIASGAKETEEKHVAFTTELVFLELRLALESLALATLAANRDAYAAAKENYQNDWHAQRILKAVEKVNPRFYPFPVDFIRKTVDEGDLIETKQPYLTRTEFVSAYDTCGDLLHARNPFKTPMDYRAKLVQAKDWSIRTNRLISHHVIHILGHDGFVMVVVDDKNVKAEPYYAVPANG